MTRKERRFQIEMLNESIRALTIRRAMAKAEGDRETEEEAQMFLDLHVRERDRLEIIGYRFDK